MTSEQEQLALRIVSHLDSGAVDGEWPEQKCRYCNGRSGGYPDSQEFNHNSSCIVPLIQDLRNSLYLES